MFISFKAYQLLFSLKEEIGTFKVEINTFKRCLIFIFLISTVSVVRGQLISQDDTLYGNEWIDYQKSYYKIKIGQDGIYRIPYETLQASGLPLNNISGSQFQMFWMGRELPIWVSTPGLLGPSDFIEFCGFKNRSELDRFLFEDPDKMLNSGYSFFSDSSSYFLTWTSGPNLRYQEIANNPGGNPGEAESWYWHEEKMVFTQSYYKPVQNSVRFSHFEEGEGYCSGMKQDHSYNILVTSLSESGPDPYITYRLTGSGGYHNVQIQWNSNNMGNVEFLSSSVILGELRLTSGDIKPENIIRFTGSGSHDLTAVGSINLRYPRSFHFENKEVVRLILGGDERKYVELQDFKHNNLPPILIDMANNIRMTGVISGDVVRYNLPATGPQRDLYIFNPESGTVTIESLEKLTFEDLHRSDAEFVIISHPDLFSDDSGIDQVSEYADYRRSPEGGNYKVRILNINQLIDQFAYGIDGHPFSVKNFSNYIARYWTKPKFIFLIGKSFLFDINRDSRYNVHLPVYGSPGSDNLLVSNHFSSAPVLPVGRLSARNGTDIRYYLDKVRIMEDQVNNAPQTIQDRIWMKKVLHLSAGTGSSEQNLIYSKMMGMASIIEENQFGGIVTRVRNQSQDVIDASVSEETLNLINSGVMIKTYFGHGGVSDTQFSGFEDPLFLNNKERYSIMLSLGCYTGNIYIDQVSLSESNILSPEKGAICYLATSALGFISALDVFGQEWYRLLGGDQMDLSLGEQFQKVIAKFDANQGIAVKTLMQQIIFHGDPAIKIIPKTKPDPVIDPSSFHFEPEIITNQTDLAQIRFDLVNIGVNSKDTFTIHVYQQGSGGQKWSVGETEVVVDRTIVNVGMPLALETAKSSGISKLIVVIDEGDFIEEQDNGGEQNNTFTQDFVIYNTNLFLFYPPPFGIVGDQNFSLSIQTSNPFVGTREYKFELDTTGNFDSPLNKSYGTSAPGGIIEWKSPSVPVPGMVYYWRVRFSGDGTEFPWQSSSFIYLPGSTGWNQSHYFQFLSNNSNDLFLDEKREWSFSENFLDITIKNHKYVNDLPFIQIGNRSFIYWAWDGPVRGGFNVNIIDGNTLQSWINQGDEYNSRLPSFLIDWPTFPYDTRSKENRANLIHLLEDIIPDGHYVVLWSIQREDLISDYEPGNWVSDSTSQDDRTLFSVLEAQGAQFIRQTAQTGAVPYFFVFKKNDPTFQPIERIANSPDETINAQITLSGPGLSGFITSQSIGPASAWDHVEWDIEGQSPSRYNKLDILGLSTAGDTALLISESENQTIDISHIMAGEYPNLIMQYASTDSVTRKPGDLQHWRVHFTGMPDLTFNPSRHFVFQRDTLQRGDEWSLELAVENIGSSSSDSSEFIFTLIDPGNGRWDTTFNVKPLDPAGFELISISRPVSVAGNHRIIVNIQPVDNRDANLSNNTGSFSFHVSEDLWNPVLDVVFDKVHIMDGDIVSAKPKILISLIDDRVLNKPVSDSTLFEIFIQYENEDLQRVSFEEGELEFFQNSDDKKIELLYTPTYQRDGTYMLTVNAKDLSGNTAGQNRFQVRFRVITEQMVSNVFNYPNPFSSSTRFVYTLTGSETPRTFKIRILTPSGKVVREITEAELGELRIGTHMTDYAWDGRDEYGDILASGVYLYQVVVKDSSGSGLKKYDTGVDSFFEHDYGKLVIIR